MTNEEILKEIPQKRQNQSWRSYQAETTNNLFLNFPMGRKPFDRSICPDQGYYLYCSQRLGLTDIPIGVDIPDYKEKGYSELWATKTTKQFVEEVWNTLPLVGTDLKTFGQNLNRWYLAPHEDPRDENLDRYICETMIKIYVILRQKGYNRRELIE